MNLFKKKKSKGQSVVELVFVMPIVMSIMFGIVEFSNMYMVALRVSNLSRAIANAAFRDCAFLSQTQMHTCLQDGVSRLSTEANLILNDFSTVGRVTASTYQYSASTPPGTLVSLRAAGSGNYTTQYTANELGTPLLQNHNRIVVGEIHYPYTAITPLRTFINILDLNTVLYEVTIY